MTSIARQEDRDRAPIEESPTVAADTEKKDPFEEIDFGSFFQDYLDPGYRSSREMEDIERPSFENFLSKPGSLTDHLVWQLGSISMRPEVEEAVELIIGNLNEDGYLIASDEELLGVAPPAPPESDAAVVENVFKEAAALGLSSSEQRLPRLRQNSIPPPRSRQNLIRSMPRHPPASPQNQKTTRPAFLRSLDLERDHRTAWTGIGTAVATAPETTAARLQRPPRVPRSQPTSALPISTRPSKS